MPNLNTNTTLLNQPGNDLSPEIKTFYRTELLEEGRPNLVHTQFGSHRPLPKGSGKSIEWRRWDAFPKAMTPLTEGVTPDGNRINVSYVTQELRQYGDYTTLSDQLELTAVDDVILECTDNHARSMALTIDHVTRNELLTGQNVVYAPAVDGNGKAQAVTSRGALDGSAVLTPALVAQVANQLKLANAPKFDGSYVAIVHPCVACDLLRHEEFIETHKYGPSIENVFDGEVGKLYGVRFVETTEAKVFRGAPLTAASETVTLGTTAVAAAEGSGTTEITLATALAEGDRVLAASEEEPVLLNVGGVTYRCVGGTAGTAGKLKLAKPHAAIAAGAVLHPGEGGRDGAPVFATLFLGKGAYGNVDLEDGTDVIIKQRGSAGSGDPLDQRSSVGWKSTYAAKILMPEFLVRVESGSARGGGVAGN